MFSAKGTLRGPAIVLSIALATGGVHAANDLAVAAAAAGGGVILGPRGKTKDFVYFFSYEDRNGNGRPDSGEPVLDQFRLEIRSKSWLSNSRYAHGLVRRDALDGFLKDFGGDKRGLAAESESFATVLGGTARINLGDHVPVIVMSSDPDRVLNALIQTAEDNEANAELFGFLGIRSELEKSDRVVRELNSASSRTQGESADLVREFTQRRQKLADLQKGFEAVDATTVKPAANGALAKLLAETDVLLDEFTKAHAAEATAGPQAAADAKGKVADLREKLAKARSEIEAAFDAMERSAREVAGS